MKTLVIFYPGCIEFEVMLAAEVLNRKYPIEVITPDGADHIGSNGMIFRASGSVASVDPIAYAVVLVPGGDPGMLVDNSVLSAKLRAVFSAGGILGAICAGPLVLERAGLLEQRRVAHGFNEEQIKSLKANGYFKATVLSNDACIAEDRIVTARPDSFIDFSVALAQMAGVIPDEKISFWRSYYRGDPAE